VTWNLNIDRDALKELGKLDKTVQERVLRFLKTRLIKRENPRDLGQALSGELGGYWKYRVGNYRIITKIEDQTITIYVIAIGHHSGIYK
jgi:mRNA interferase RelE/StbE